jgi:tRNA A37 threonylcarbamoyladenosine synthetase subunit TsaC/SUA5/YrdC
LESFTNPKDAAQWVLSDKILLHPTEGVWGLGCLYDSKNAINRISELKQRSEAKKLYPFNAKPSMGTNAWKQFRSH